MRQINSTLFLVSLVAAFLLFTGTACRKATAPVPQTAHQENPARSVDDVKQQRLAWNLKTLIEPYESAGFANPEWDAAAKLALTEFARARAKVLDKNEPCSQIISKNASAAIQSGCKDPMVTYLYIKFAMDQANDKQAFSKAFVAMARAMNKSSYPPIRKYYAALRTVDQLFFTYGTNSMTMPAVQEIEPWIDQNLIPAIQDKTMPPVEAYEACKEALNLFNGDTNNYSHTYSCIEKPIFENWPNEYTSWLLKGEAYIKLGWNARGSGYVDTVTEEGAKTFSTDLAIAEQALNRAWELNPNDQLIAVKMIWVELGQGQGQDRMELWFRRAMALDPNNYDACNAKLLYIEPKWYGSVKDMLDFGRLCLQNTNWGGHVPLTLADAHWDIALQYVDKSDQANYWKQPGVWSDIQSAYNRVFQLNPNDTDLYYYYARFAYRAEDWSKLKELIPRLGPKINYGFFGGKEEFDKVVQLAEENAGKSN
jgi:hypothetical protein